MKRKTLTQLPLAGSEAKSPVRSKQKPLGAMVKKAEGQRRIDWSSLIGHKFHLLTVISIFGKDLRGKVKLACRCECGNLGVYLHGHMNRGATQSCGCLHGRAVTTHGHCVGGASKMYHAHRNMFDRCFGINPRHVQYRRKGITVCRRWTEGEKGLSAFECFIKDMGQPPSPQHTVERIDNDGNYTPSNCRWATKLEQQNNTDWNVRVKAFGKTLTITQSCESLGISRSGMRNRLRKWSPERALTEPVHMSGMRIKFKNKS